MNSDVSEFRWIVENISTSVIVTSLSGNILFANAVCEKLIGYSRDELTSLLVEDIIANSKEVNSWEHIKDVVLSKVSRYNSEVHLICKNKSTIICNANVFCVYSNENIPECIVLVFRDISNEISSSEKLKKKNLELARINSELLRSNKDLKKISEIKTKFLSIASHELKTPLTSIKGYTEIILTTMKDKVDNEIGQMIESISRAAEKLHEVINNMLDVTRIEQKRLRLKPVDMNLKETMLLCINELNQLASQRNMTFKWDIEENLPLFYGDKMRIQQVFTNLLSNALKYSPDNSEIEIKISIEDDRYYHIIIIDHGIGIDKEEQEKIFKPFYEIARTIDHNTDTSKYMGGGTGLGLSIVKGIIERHGGLVWVKSDGTAQGKFPGSEFHINLPLKSIVQWDDDETQLIKLHKVMGSHRKKRDDNLHDDTKKSILIIDDDRDAVKIVRRVLQPEIEIITAETGEDGLRIAFKRKPSLILLDLYLPGLDGCQISKILRSQEETRNIPISFFSAATQNEEIERCYASGADDFIIKPFDSKELTEKINRLLM